MQRQKSAMTSKIKPVQTYSRVTYFTVVCFQKDKAHTWHKGHTMLLPDSVEFPFGERANKFAQSKPSTGLKNCKMLLTDDQQQKFVGAGGHQDASKPSDQHSLLPPCLGQH